VPEHVETIMAQDQDNLRLVQTAFNEGPSPAAGMAWCGIVRWWVQCAGGRP
jgi:hypothetical protein